MSRPQSLSQAASPGRPPVANRVNRVAIWSLVLAILTLGGLGSIAGIIMGVSARRQLEVTGERGAGVAMAGVVVGIITLLLAIAYWIFLGMHAGGGSGGSGGGGGGGY